MKTELFLSGRKVEINEDIDFVLNRQFTELTDLTSVIVDYSKTIRVPMTPNNNELFNFIFRLQRKTLIGSEYIDYDPTIKIPMYMSYNSSLVMDGYAVLSKADLLNKVYEINLYGQLGKIFSELKSKKISEYVTDNVMMDPITLNKASVYSSFRSEQHGISWDSQWWTDYFGFAPQMLGKNSGFTTDEFELGTVIYKLDSVLAEGRKQMVAGGLDINQYGEIRSYMTRPYVYVNKLVQLVKNEIDTGDYDGYHMVLDDNWFKTSNPYYNDMVYFPGIEQSINDESTNTGGTANLGNRKTTIIQAPTLLQPTITEDDISGYNFVLSNGVFSVTPTDESSPCSVILNGNNFIIEDEWTGTDISYSDVPKIDYALLNKNTTWPIRYVGVYDVNDNLIYRICLVENKIKNVEHKTSFLHWSTTVTSSPDLWKALVRADERNIIPSSCTYVSSLSNNVLKRTLTFSFGNIQIDTDVFKFKFGCMDVRADGTLINDNINLSTSDYYPIPFKKIDTAKTVSGTHSMSVTIPTTITLSNGNNRSGSKISIIDILGVDFTPFTWLMDYVKKFRLSFDIDYASKTILLTDRYFSSEGYVGDDYTLPGISTVDVTVDYSKPVIIEPLVDAYERVYFGYRESESQKGIQYKKEEGVDYGDLRIDTGISLNNEYLYLNSRKDDEGVFIPVTTNAFTWSAMKSSGSPVQKKILQTNNIINTLDKDGNIKYYPFYCFRLGNAQLSYTSSTPVDDKIRLTDDTTTQRALGKYCYISPDADDVIEELPEFDNMIVKTITDDPHYAGSYKKVFWSTFGKPKKVYNGWIEPHYTDYSIYNRWNHYLEEIFSPNNKKVTCYVRMSYPEFISFKFNQLFLIDGAQFLVNKIVDFNPNTDEPTKVELIQIQEKANLS